MPDVVMHGVDADQPITAQAERAAYLDPEWKVTHRADGSVQRSMMRFATLVLRKFDMAGIDRRKGFVWFHVEWDEPGRGRLRADITGEPSTMNGETHVTVKEPFPVR